MNAPTPSTTTRTTTTTPRRRRSLLGAAAAAAVLLTACGSTTAPAPAAGGGGGGGEGPRKITLILGTNSDDFYKAIECGAKTEAAKSGVALDVQGAGQFDPALQVPIVNAVAASRPDAIIIAPTDDTALYPPLKSAVDQGTKLVLVDTNLKDTTLAAGHIGSDYVLYGRQGAQQLASALGEKGTVLGVFSPPGVSTNDLGRQGFSEELAKHPGITLLPFEYSSGAAGKSAAIMTAVLAAHPDLTGVFTFNGGDSEGIVTSLRQAGKADAVQFVSGDAQPFQVDQLNNKLVDALVVQQARTMGERGVQYAIKAIQGEQVPRETALPTVVGTLATLSTPDVANNLYKAC